MSATTSESARPTAVLNPGLAVDTGRDGRERPDEASGPGAVLLFLTGAVALLAATAAARRRRPSPGRGR